MILQKNNNKNNNKKTFYVVGHMVVNVNVNVNHVYSGHALSYTSTKLS